MHYLYLNDPLLSKKSSNSLQFELFKLYNPVVIVVPEKVLPVVNVFVLCQFQWEITLKWDNTKTLTTWYIYLHIYYICHEAYIHLRIRMAQKRAAKTRYSSWEGLIQGHLLTSDQSLWLFTFLPVSIRCINEWHHSGHIPPTENFGFKNYLFVYIENRFAAIHWIFCTFLSHCGSIKILKPSCYSILSLCDNQCQATFQLQLHEITSSSLGKYNRYDDQVIYSNKDGQCKSSTEWCQSGHQFYVRSKHKIKLQIWLTSNQKQLQ